MENISGFLNINKPEGCTSHDVVAILRKSVGIKKIGHAGTLDPASTGVLVIGLNEATRLFEYLASDKVYLAKITFGIETDSNDITGNIIKRDGSIPSIEEIKEKLKSFTGKINQKPPIFSAVKINGTRAYKLARKKKISLDNIKEKIIEIYSIEIISFSNNELEIKIHCSSGTYIRSIARDLGNSLNTCAVLSSLKRTSVGKFFNIEQSIKPESICKTNIKEYLIPPQLALDLQKVYLDFKEINDITQGKEILTKAGGNHGVPLQLLDNKNNLIAIGSIAKECIIKPKKVFIKNGKYT